MKRHQQILLGALVIQVVLAVVVFWPRTAVSGVGEPAIPGLSAADVVALAVVDNEGAQVALRKIDGAWVLPDAGNYPAKEATITPLLDKLVELDTATLVAQTEASHRALQVSEDTFQRRLDVEMQDGTRHTIYLGSAPRYTATHFRVEGQAETYLTTDVATWEFNALPSAWIETAYGTLDQTTVTAVTLENANGVFELVKDGDNWTLADLQADEEVAVTATSAIVRNACSLSVQTPLGTDLQPDYGLDEPAAVVTLETSDGATHVLHVGAKGPDEVSYTVKHSDSPYYVRVAEYSVRAMVENARADFLQAPVEATPTTP